MCIFSICILNVYIDKYQIIYTIYVHVVSIIIYNIKHIIYYIEYINIQRDRDRKRNSLYSLGRPKSYYADQIILEHCLTSARILIKTFRVIFNITPYIFLKPQINR